MIDTWFLEVLWPLAAAMWVGSGVANWSFTMRWKLEASSTDVLMLFVAMVIGPFTWWEKRTVKTKVVGGRVQ